MREITFIRKKNSTLAGLRVSIYAETAGKGMVEIHSTPCTLLGSLADGGRLSVSLGEGDIKLFFVTEDASGSETGIGFIPAGNSPVSGHPPAMPSGSPILQKSQRKTDGSGTDVRGTIRTDDHLRRHLLRQLEMGGRSMAVGTRLPLKRRRTYVDL